MRMFEFQLQFAWNFFKGSIDNIYALVKVMAWCQAGAKLLPEPILTQFTDTYMRL